MQGELIISKTNKFLEEKVKNKNYILMGEWLLEDFQKEEIKKYNFKIPNPASIDRENRKKSYLNCEEIFKNIFNDFYKELNRIHNIKLSERAWRIISETWLKKFIYICYNKKETLDIAVAQYSIDIVHLRQNNDFKFFTKDCFGQYDATLNNDWNSNLYNKIINYFNYSFNINSEMIDSEFINFQSFNEIIKNNKRSFVYNFFKKLLSLNKFFIKNDDALIFRTYLPFKIEKLIEIKLNQLPQLWVEDEINFKEFDLDKRRNISFRKKDNSDTSLENFVRELLPHSLPISFLESFTDIYKKSGHHKFPKDPKFIFISTGFEHDEILKFYIARQVDKGKKYFVGQHGSSYFTQYDANFRSEVNTSDKFFSWGFLEEDKKQVLPVFNLKTFNRKIKADPKGKLIIVCRSLGHNVETWDKYHEVLNGIKKVSNLMNMMNENIREKTLVRLHETYKLDRSNYFLEKFFGNFKSHLEFGDISYNRLIRKGRLICFNYDGTGFLENLSYNIPSVLIWDGNFNHINEKFEKKYRLLMDANIIFNDEKELVNHIENKWENIHEWWNSKKVQNSIHEFNKDYNKTGNERDLRGLIQILKNEKNYNYYN